MIIQCGWCGIIMRANSDNHEPEPKISHGICSSCSEKVYKELEEYKQHIDSKNNHAA